MHYHDVLYRYKSHPSSLAQCSVSNNTAIIHGVQLSSECTQNASSKKKCRAGGSSFEVGRLKCSAWAAKQPIARAARKHFSLSFSKGDLMHADQYWKCSRQVVHAKVGIPRLQLASGNVSETTLPLLVSVRIASSASTELTTTILT